MGNSIYYKVTGDLTSDFGEVITNPVIKVSQVGSNAQTLRDGMLRFEYKVYLSESIMLEGKDFFKVWDTVEDKRIKNFTYPIMDVISWSITTYKILQIKIIADTFGFNIEDIELVN
tara:strand:+ start:1494 stop:1841 length:348 start_codon:yes stop_codon:yes gene_type:complete